ncbi:helix-turn-helix transcriptional regulator [Nocardia bhagyanarayanae]|uniref:DNA-binding CsgD family transcriptional regulator n=1 Tax=Nocardia bhagyanarayanae TaxID=1215925 RepID=A0A543FHB4_9NOCA|nr:LuxR C-terminal-related transcriptional regulator [Nocardia bhagyanarayanae]TQM33258.1 DNA-binding CsgD family transcriptional regulator [Nocardia bhagyanarayanae]
MSTYRAETARAALDALSRAGLPWQEFGENALDILVRAVPFDSACFGTIDPNTSLVTGSVKVGLGEPCEAEFAFHEYVRDEVSLFRDLASRDVGVSILHEETGGDPRRSSRFRELFEPVFGLGHELRAMMRCGGQTWGGVAIYRGLGSSGFSPAEADFLDGLSGTLAVGIRAGLIADAAGAPVQLHDSAEGPVVLTFDSDNEVCQATPAAEQRIAELGGDLWRELPQPVLAIVAAARALESGRARTVPRVQVRSRLGEWLTVHASPLNGRGAVGSQVVVTIERAGASEVVPLVVAAFGLTPRERDVVEAVLRGATTAEIAKQLHLSPYTVQDHLKVVFDKTGVSSRRELMSKVFFDHYAPRIGNTLGPSGWFADREPGTQV